MKKSIILIFVAMLALTSCSGSKTAESSSAVSQPSSSLVSSSEKESQPQEVIVEEMFSLADVANKSIEEVNAVLGEPGIVEDGTWKYSGTDTVIENCPTAYYKDSSVEVKFIEGKAVRITVTPTDTVPFSTKSLSLIGVIGEIPTNKNSNSVSWNGIDGIYEITMFNKEQTGYDSDTISYIYIITDEIYK